jgi:hypothetical protein
MSGGRRTNGRRGRQRDGVRLSNRRRSTRLGQKDIRAKEAKKGILMVSTSFFVVAAVGIFAFTRPTIELDKNNCVIGQSIPGHTIFLIDGTDKIDGDYLYRLKESISLKKDNLPVSEKLTIVRLSGNADGDPEFKKLFSKCNPGQGSQFAGITESKMRKQVQWEKGFGDELDDALNDLSKLKVGVSSPIIESINRLTYERDFGVNTPNRNLILVSDLMQHTDDFTHYKDNYSFSDVRNMGKPYTGVPLDAVEVDVIYIRRQSLKGFQTERHEKFWNRYFVQNGANLAELANY